MGMMLMTMLMTIANDHDANDHGDGHVHDRDGHGHYANDHTDGYDVGRHDALRYYYCLSIATTTSTAIQLLPLYY
jgi:hypothetical protein